jgi:hypothetical protein
MKKIQKKDERPYHILERSHLDIMPKDINYSKCSTSGEMQIGKSIVIEYTREKLEKKGQQDQCNNDD